MNGKYFISLKYLFCFVFNKVTLFTVFYGMLWMNNISLIIIVFYLSKWFMPRSCVNLQHAFGLRKIWLHRIKRFCYELSPKCCLRLYILFLKIEIHLVTRWYFKFYYILKWLRRCNPSLFVYAKYWRRLIVRVI